MTTETTPHPTGAAAHHNRSAARRTPEFRMRVSRLQRRDAAAHEPADRFGRIKLGVRLPDALIARVAESAERHAHPTAREYERLLASWVDSTPRMTNVKVYRGTAARPRRRLTIRVLPRLIEVLDAYSDERATTRELMLEAVLLRELDRGA